MHSPHKRTCLAWCTLCALCAAPLSQAQATPAPPGRGALQQAVHIRPSRLGDAEKVNLNYFSVPRLNPAWEDLNRGRTEQAHTLFARELARPDADMMAVAGLVQATPPAQWPARIQALLALPAKATGRHERLELALLLWYQSKAGGRWTAEGGWMDNIDRPMLDRATTLLQTLWKEGEPLAGLALVERVSEGSGGQNLPAATPILLTLLQRLGNKALLLVYQNASKDHFRDAPPALSAVPPERRLAVAGILRALWSGRSAAMYTSYNDHGKIAWMKVAGDPDQEAAQTYLDTWIRRLLAGAPVPLPAD